MFKTVKKYQKAIMAVFAVGLMIIFVANIGSNPSNNRMGDPTLGKIFDGEKVRYQELTNARRAWDQLKRTYLVNVMGSEPVPALFRLAPYSFIRNRGSIPQALLDRDADAFFALIKEADHLGLTASEDDVQELLRNVAPISAPRNEEDAETLQYAFTALLKVEAAYQRASSVMKVSAPQRELEMARFGQELKVNFVEFTSDSFKASVPAPTPQQLTAQFEKFANFAPDQPVEETNPFGFGYRYPNRVKVEFISVLREQLKDVVRKSKDDATWEIETRMEYRKNRSQYPTTKPSEKEKISEFVAAPTTGPTTRPLGFEDYRTEIFNTLVDAEADKLAESVSKRVVSIMDQDWNAFRAAVGNAATQPTSRPAGPVASTGTAYGTDQYLASVAARIQEEFKFLPVVNTLNKDWLNQKDLLGTGIGTARVPGRNFLDPGIMFPQYATTLVEAFGHTPSGRDPAPTLSVMQPSPPLIDDRDNFHVFRLTGADPAHAAKEMEPFKEQVEKDYRTAEQIRLAKVEAEKLLEPAKKDGLEAVANSLGRRYLTSGVISFNGVASNENLQLKSESQQVLRKAAFDLLQDAEAIKAGRTVAVVELPRDGKVLVITLAEVKPTQPDRPLYQIEGSFSRLTALEIEDRFLADWFNPPNILKRTNLQLDNKKPKSDSE